MPLFSVALFAMKVTGDVRNGVHVDAYAVADVACSESQQQAEEDCLKTLLGVKPISEGWRGLRTVPIPLEEFIDKRIDETLDRWERGESSEPDADDEFITGILQ